jgi:hypothetical protein
MEAVVSRGRKKPSLRDLSNLQHLNDHIQEMLHELEHQSDRGVALVAAAMVQVQLKLIMRCRIVDFKDSENILFDKEGAPLSTFSDCIKVARAFGVIGPVIYLHLETIRKIRNQFAHSPRSIDFTNDLIAAEIRNLLPDQPEWKPELTVERRRYLSTCIQLIQAMDAVARQHVSDTIPLWLP